MKNERLPILIKASDAHRIMKLFLEEYDISLTPSCNMFLCPYGVDEIDEDTQIWNESSDIDQEFTKEEKFAVIFLLYKKYGLVPMFPTELCESVFSKPLPIKRTIGETVKMMRIEERPNFAITIGSMIQNSGRILKGFFIHEFSDSKVFDRRINQPQKLLLSFTEYLHSVTANQLPAGAIEALEMPMEEEPDEKYEETIFLQEIIEKMTSCKGDLAPSSEELFDEDVEYE